MIFSPVSDLKLLYENSTSPSISIYLPTLRVGGATRQDPIRLKNLLGQAEDQNRAWSPNNSISNPFSHS